MTVLNPWPTRLPIIGVTGGINTGKTLFAATIDPKNTLYFDLEKGAETYEALGFKRIDLPAELLAIHPNGYSACEMFTEWLDILKGIKPGRYSVIVVDPVSDIEDGLCDWVRNRYREFGFTSADKFLAMGGVYWSKVKSEWKKILVDLATKCHTFVFCSHLKKVWKFGKPTDQDTPRGKTTLTELATLYLFLERNVSGDKPMSVPAATVLKGRTATVSMDSNGEAIISPQLPPRIPKCTPQEIRKYLTSTLGVNYQKLSSEEIKIDPVMTEDQKLELQSKITEDKMEAEKAALERERLKVGIYTKPQQAQRAELFARTAENEIQACQQTEPPQSGAYPFVTEALGTEDGPTVVRCREFYWFLKESKIDVSGFLKPKDWSKYREHWDRFVAESQEK